MISSITDEITLLLSGQLAPFILMIKAVVFLLIGHIFRIPLVAMFLLASICLWIAFALGFGIPIAIEQPFFAFHVDMLSRVGLKLLLPAIFVVGLLILQKRASYDKKAASLLLLFISGFGGMVTMISHNWMMFFLGIQCLSLPIYGLIAFDTDDRESIASSVRYLVLSLMAMAFTLFGILLLYAASGTLDMYQQAQLLSEIFSSTPGLLVLGFAFILVGLLFKASLFPFHVWAPDVYQGAPMFVVGIMVVIFKSVVLLFLLRCFFVLFAEPHTSVVTIITWLAVMSMWIGNGLALRETRLTRLLAYLSIGHLGYLMIPVIARTSIGVEALFIDLAGFGAAVLLLVAAIKSLPEKFSKNVPFAEFRGLLIQYPWQAMVITAALISMAGFPLTIGFVGKYAVFQTGVDAGLWLLIGNMVLSSIIGFFAIARLVTIIFGAPSLDQPAREFSSPIKKSLVVVGAIALVLFGSYPQPLVAWVKAHAAHVESITHASHDSAHTLARNQDQTN